MKLWSVDNFEKEKVTSDHFVLLQKDDEKTMTVSRHFIFYKFPSRTWSVQGISGRRCVVCRRRRRRKKETNVGYDALTPLSASK